MLNLAVAFTPTAVLGLLFHDAIKQLLFSPVVVATAFDLFKSWDILRPEDLLVLWHYL